jgi:hypothetical protein
MTDWRPTASLGRALVTGAVGIGLAVVFGEPVLVVLVAPMVVVAALGLLHRPSTRPRLHTSLDHVTLTEGQGTQCRLFVDGADDVEQVTRVAARAPYVTMQPADGGVSVLLEDDDEPPALEVSPRRWGLRVLGEERVGLTGPWAGYRWGPVLLPGRSMSVVSATVCIDLRF